MKVDVPVREFIAALMEYGKPCDVTTGAIGHALAAVIPAIRAAEREQVARWHDEQAATEDRLSERAGRADERSAFADHRRATATHRKIAAAIRALKEGT